MSAADPFYLVKEDIDESVQKVEADFLSWEHKKTTGPIERGVLRKELLSGIESIELQVNELDKAISVAQRDPTRFGLDASEIGRRRRWSSDTHEKIEALKQFLQDGTGKPAAARREFMRLEDDRPGPKPNRKFVEGNDDFLSMESERQALILKEQDEDLDELSASVMRIGGVGLTIHEELAGQEKIIDDLEKDMDDTAGRLDFVHKRVAFVLKKAGMKGQLCLIVSLVVLLMILIMLVFFF